VSALARPCPGGARALTESSAPYVSQVKGCCVLATSCTGCPRCGVPNGSANQLALGAQRRPDDSSRSCSLRRPRPGFTHRKSAPSTLSSGTRASRLPVDHATKEMPRAASPARRRRLRCMQAHAHAPRTHTHARTLPHSARTAHASHPLFAARPVQDAAAKSLRGLRGSFKWGAPFVFFLEKRKLTNSVQMLTAWLD